MTIEEQDKKEFEEWYKVEHPEPYYQGSRLDQVMRHDIWLMNKQFRKEGWLASRHTLRKQMKPHDLYRNGFPNG